MNKKFKITKENLAISIILIFSAVLNLANIGIEGYANTYYAAGVKSMMMNLKNFFFVSFDPSGFVTIDKPPLGFWIQTIFAKIFGFSGWSIILPQALAGVISVWLMYYLVKRTFGSIPALIAALCLTVTPIFVAASRNNTIDNLLVLALLAACLAISKAAEEGKFGYLILSLVFVGIGFNIKMVEAYMVAPALYITYLLSSKLSLKKRIQHLILGSIVLLAVSFSWALAVDLTPTVNRPFVGSSTNNSVMELIIGHNGLERIGLGKSLKIGVFDNSKNKNTADKTSSESKKLPENFSRMEDNNKPNDNSNLKNKKMPTNNMNFGGMGNGSKAGIARLFSYNNISDQISWLLPFALIGFLAAAIKENLKVPFDNKTKLSLILWITWLIPEFIYFSFTKGSFHTYYLTTMAPSIAALTGIGLWSMWELYKEHSKAACILPISLIINGFVQIKLLSYNYKVTSYKTIIIVVGVLCILSSLILAVLQIIKNRNLILNKVLVAIAFIGILVAPTVWSFTPMFYKMNGSSPSAGLELSRNKQVGNFSSNTNSKLIEFLENNKSNEKYLVAVPSAMNYASDIILKTGEPVMTIGGFSGSDKIITLDQFKKSVKNGEIRYVIVNGTIGRIGASKNGSNSDIMNWVKENGELVPNTQWQNNVSSKNQKSNGKSNMNGQRNSIELYDLSKK
ncbi:glycosyltransferase family 39 protein [Clostridium drakei]|uniref:Dolichyl-phosphate-mannose--protein mannosyltransferase n=1 Tax=Clostridium drakei TaxID=332101 RepID=A0A2U8DR75_9CLOT|nr:glycosyltransferase family 39 protein [Clostridium drakei]AWI04955.1 dolichyl-phosphate-mannose--protein mannosyltransferase [Clostridium drakei]